MYINICRNNPEESYRNRSEVANAMCEDRGTCTDELNMHRKLEAAVGMYKKITLTTLGG